MFFYKWNWKTDFITFINSPANRDKNLVATLFVSNQAILKLEFWKDKLVYYMLWCKPNLGVSKLAYLTLLALPFSIMK